VKIVVDMNLSPEWVPLFVREGFEACHWKDIGETDAPDVEIVHWAAHNNHVVLTQDLDFAQLLFMTRAVTPSVVLLRIHKEHDDAIRQHVLRSFHQLSSLLESGHRLVVLGEHRARWQTLPIDHDSGDAKL
jgi:predicted nuclease of predicted toxin-antitoxin system